jgi:hypothetical protein
MLPQYIKLIFRGIFYVRSYVQMQVIERWSEHGECSIYSFTAWVSFLHISLLKMCLNTEHVKQEWLLCSRRKKALLYFPCVLFMCQQSRSCLADPEVSFGA